VAAPEPLPEDFSQERAWAHLETLAGIGPRVSGTTGVARAQEYVRNELRRLGLEVGEQRTRIELRSPQAVLELVNLVGVVPGDSPDTILLVAPYDSVPGERGVGANDCASGAALVLELGRALAAKGLPYTVWLALVEGDALVRDERSGARVLVGTGALARALEAEGRMPRVRLAAYFNRVADPDLHIARDLLSNRAWREEFWAAARRLGHVEAFPPDAPFESVDEGHRAFLDLGMRWAVAIVDTRSGAESPPADPASGEQDDLERCSPESLAIVGAVSLDALRAVAARLAKIDRFVESPLAVGEGSGVGSREAPGSTPPPQPVTPAQSAPPPQPVTPAQSAPPPQPVTPPAQDPMAPAPDAPPVQDPAPPQPVTPAQSAPPPQPAREGTSPPAGAATGPDGRP
jgi:hypothetical protein